MAAGPVGARRQRLARIGLEIGHALSVLGGAAHVDILIEQMAAMRRARRETVAANLRHQVLRALLVFERLSRQGARPVFERVFGDGARRWRIVVPYRSLDGLVAALFEGPASTTSPPPRRRRMHLRRIIVAAPERDGDGSGFEPSGRPDTGAWSARPH